MPIDRFSDEAEQEAWTNAKLIEIASTSLASIRDALEKMDSDERVVFLGTLQDGYCRECGSDEGWRCQCSNDE